MKKSTKKTIRIEVEGENKVIERIPYSKGSVGNFEPIWIRYNKKEYLLRSKVGDTSDPFRAHEASGFYISPVWQDRLRNRSMQNVSFEFH